MWGRITEAGISAALSGLFPYLVSLLDFLPFINPAIQEELLPGAILLAILFSLASYIVRARVGGTSILAYVGSFAACIGFMLMLGIVWGVLLEESPRHQIVLLGISYILLFVGVGVVLGSAFAALGELRHRRSDGASSDGRSP